MLAFILMGLLFLYAAANTIIYSTVKEFTLDNFDEVVQIWQQS